MTTPKEIKCILPEGTARAVFPIINRAMKAAYELGLEDGRKSVAEAASRLFARAVAQVAAGGPEAAALLQLREATLTPRISTRKVIRDAKNQIVAIEDET